MSPTNKNFFKAGQTISSTPKLSKLISPIAQMSGRSKVEKKEKMMVLGNQSRYSTTWINGP
jgi:hypothetical protein